MSTKRRSSSRQASSGRGRSRSKTNEPNEASGKDNSSTDGSDGTPDAGHISSYLTKKAKSTTKTFNASRPDNYQSLRRQCNRNNTTNNTKSSQENLRSISTTYTSRITVKLSLPTSNDPLSTLVSAYQALLTKFKEVTQGTIGIIPWRNDDIPRYHSITEPSHVPNILGKLLVYSPRLFPGKANKPNVVYAKIHLAHECLFNDIQSELSYWLRSNNHGMYYNMLQAESVVDIGWLLYSLRCMDAGALAEELFDQYGIEIGFRWKIINQGVKGKLPAEQRISALHVEAKLEKKSSTIKALLELYGRTNSKNIIKPNGVKFRFVTLRSSATSRSSITKLTRLRTRQKKFLSKICQSSSWDIVFLDHTIRKTTPTLRNLIMNLKSTEYEDVHLFHSVDLDYNGDGFVFTYLPELKAESESAIQTLFPLIRHHNNGSKNILNDTPTTAPNETQAPPDTLTDTEIKTFFTQEALDRTEDMYYDKLKNCIIDPLIDNNLEFVIEDDTLEKLLGPDTVELDTNPESNTPGRPAPRLLHSSLVPQGDNDSISTFGESIYSRRTENSTRSRFRSGTSQLPVSDESVASSTTTVTTDEFNSLNNRVHSISSQLAQNQNQNNEILKLLRLNSIPNTARADQPDSVSNDAGEVFDDASEGLE